MKRLYTLLAILFSLSCSPEKQQSEEKVANPLHEQAYAYRDEQKSDSAFIYFEKAKEVFLRNKDSIGVASCLVNSAIISTNMGDYFGGQELSLSAIPYLKKDDKTHHAYLHSNYNNLGISSERLRDYENAFKFYDQAIKFATDSSTVQLYLNNKANAYQETKQFKDALLIYNQLLKETRKDDLAYARVLANVAISKWHLNQKYNALPELETSLRLRKKLGDLWGLNSIYAYLSDYYAHQNVDTALAYSQKMLQVAKQLDSPDDQLFALQKLVKFSQSSSRNTYFIKYLKLDDSLQTLRNLAKNRFALVKFETEKHKADNLVLQKQNSEKTYQIIIITTVSIIALAIGLFWYRKRQQDIKINAEKTINENKLKTSKKVHDVVANGLYRVMIEIENEPELDKERILDKIEDMYEKSRDISYDKTAISRNNFKDNLNHLLKSFKSDTIEIRISGNTTDLWQQTSTKTQYEIEHILQELMVNMTKHSGATIVSITFEQDRHNIVICYTDNGIGIPKDTPFNNGLTNTGNRIKSISGSVTFDSQIEKGLKIHITFPVS